MNALFLNAADSEAIRRAAQFIRRGGLVAFPTETVYGLGADAFNPIAVAKIFEVKKRPSFDPLIVHICKKEQVSRLWKSVPPLAEKLMEEFWPGPLTIVLEKKEDVPDIVTAGLTTVAVRMPKNQAALSLIEFSNTPIAAPSANLYGYTSPTTAQAVADDLGNSVDAILDAGAAEIGIESTVVKIENDEIVILRPGGVTLEALKKIAGTKIASGKKEEIFESPGQAESHYAPWTRFILMDKAYEKIIQDLQKTQEMFLKEKKPWPRIGLLCFDAKKESALFESVEVLSEKGDLYEAAANLFQAMRKLDKMHLDLILAEPVDMRGIGLGIMDRLKKASAGKSGLQEFFNARHQ